MLRDKKPEDLATNVKKIYHLKYSLTYDEAYESFYLLANKWSLKQKLVIGIMLTLVAVTMLVLRYFNSSALHYSFIALIATLILFYLIYGPVIKAKQGAKKVKKQKGIYKIGLTKAGEIILPNGEKVLLSSDKDARVIETNDIFALRPDRRHTFCIPKRILKKEEEEIREIFKAYLSYQCR